MNNFKIKMIEILLLLIIAFSPTAFFLKNGIFLNGDATFPIDGESKMLYLNPFFAWGEDNFGADILEATIREPLRSFNYIFLNFNYDFAQFFYYYFIFFLGAIGIFCLSSLFIKSKIFRFIAVLLYLVNFWTMNRWGHVYLLQGAFITPLLFFFYLKYLQKGNLKYLALHTLFFPFLGAIHIFLAYFFILFIWNLISLFSLRKEYKKEFLLSLKIGCLAVLSLAFFILPFAHTMITRSTSSISSSKLSFSTSEAYKFYSGDQDVFNSMALLSPERFLKMLGFVNFYSIGAKILSVFIPTILILLLISYFLFRIRLNRYSFFLILLFFLSILFSSFHFITDSVLVKKIVVFLFPPSSVDTNMAIPLLMIPFAIMIGSSLERISKTNIVKKWKYFLILPFVFLFFLLIVLIVQCSDFKQISNQKLKEITYLRDKIDNDSYLMIYPVSTIIKFNGFPYPIHYGVLFNFDRKVSFLPLQTTFPKAREFILSSGVSPEILEELGFGQILILKQVEGVDYKPYIKLLESFKNSDYKLFYEDEKAIILKTEKYKPVIYLSSKVVFSDREDAGQLRDLKNLENDGLSLLANQESRESIFKVNNFGTKETFLFYQEKGQFFLPNDRFYSLRVSVKSENKEKVFEKIKIDNVEANSNLQKQDKLKAGWHSYSFDKEFIDNIAFEFSPIASGERQNSIKEIKRGNSTKYKIRLEANSPFWFIFNESFQEDWQLFLKPADDKNESEKLAVASLIKNYKNSLSIKSHFIVNGFTNGWYISKEDLNLVQKNNKESKDLEAILIYKPQAFYEIGFTISGLTLIFALVLLLKGFLLKNEQK